MDWPNIILQGCAMIGLQAYSWSSWKIFVNHLVIAAPSSGVPGLTIGLLAAASILEQIIGMIIFLYKHHDNKSLAYKNIVSSSIINVYAAFLIALDHHRNENTMLFRLESTRTYVVVFYAAFVVVGVPTLTAFVVIPAPVMYGFTVIHAVICAFLDFGKSTNERGLVLRATSEHSNIIVPPVPQISSTNSEPEPQILGISMGWTMSSLALNLACTIVLSRSTQNLDPTASKKDRTTMCLLLAIRNILSCHLITLAAKRSGHVGSAVEDMVFFNGWLYLMARECATQNQRVPTDTLNWIELFAFILLGSVSIPAVARKPGGFLAAILMLVYWLSFLKSSIRAASSGTVVENQ